MGGLPHARLLEKLLDEEVSIELVYPNLALGRGLRHSVVFTHGHFTESIYRAMSDVSAFMFPSDPEPRELSVEEIELENFAWIDFLWSLLGRSGAVGDHVQQVYELASDKDGRQALSERLTKAIHKYWKLPWLPDVIEVPVLKKLVDLALEWLVDHGRLREGASEGEGQGEDEDEGEDDAHNALEFARGPLHRQINHERRGEPPARVTMIFGHTHRPFVSSFEGGESGGAIALCNTGGWVVDTVVPKRSHGAAVAVVGRRPGCGAADSSYLCEYGCAAIRMYNEPHEGQPTYPIEVTRIPDGSDADAALATALAQNDLAAGPWERFKIVVHEAIALRRLALHRRRHAETE